MDELMFATFAIRSTTGLCMCVCVCSDRAEGLVALFDDVLQLSQHCDLCVLQLQLLSGSVCYTCLVGGLRLVCLPTQI